MPDSICPICEEPLSVDNGHFYLEDGIRRSACERCVSALMHAVLLQKLKRLEKGDARLMVRESLGIKGEYRPLTVHAK